MASKQRSPNYPAMGLSDAVAAVRLIHEKEKRTPVSAEVIATALTYKSLSGPVRAKIAALKKYGLLDGDERKGLRVSDLAMRILFPADEVQALEAKRIAALSPEIFKAIYDEMREGSEAALLSYLINKREFAPNGAKQAIAAYRDTVSFAELSGMGYTASGTSDKEEAQTMQTEAKSASAVPIPATGVNTNAWTWTLSMPRNVKAELRIAGDATKSDIARLRKQIEFLEESFDEEG